MNIWKLIPIFFSLAVCGCRRGPVNNYPGTAQQAGVVHLMLSGRGILSALRNFHSKHGEWPDSLHKLVDEELIEDSELRYPAVYDLQDRRDLKKIEQHLEWIYSPPSSMLDNEVILLAPLPFTHSMGVQMDSPHRIVVLLAERSKIVREDEVSGIVTDMLKRTK
ncbi:MAG: hypothetical protein JNN17_07590 [Verrucomicrobiaceae bacterium]|nr:hypothetical protein [Verrucomicrobiaceae bacterium]